MSIEDTKGNQLEQQRDREPDKTQIVIRENPWDVSWMTRIPKNLGTHDIVGSSRKRQDIPPEPLVCQIVVREMVSIPRLQPGKETAITERAIASAFLFPSGGSDVPAIRRRECLSHCPHHVKGLRSAGAK